MSTSRFNLPTAAFLDLVARFYGGEQAGDFVVNRIALPIGMSAVGQADRRCAADGDAALLKTGADGKPVYPRTLPALNDTADPVALIRNALSAQTDQNAAVVLAGPPVNLVALIALPDGRAGRRRKARVLSDRRRTLRRAAPPIRSMRADVAGFRKLLADWPSPIVMAGAELNEALPFPGTQSRGELCVGAEPSGRGRVSRVQADAVRRAVAGAGGGAPRRESGRALLPPLGARDDHGADDGRTTIHAVAAGQHHYLIAKPDQKERVLQAYVQMVSAQPPPRPGRGGPRPAAGMRRRRSRR